MSKVWNIKTIDPQQQHEFSQALKISPTIAQVLINRDITSLDEATAFLSSGLTHLHDPLTLKNIQKAIDRITKAQANNEIVLVFGDYDVDGVTSSALLTGFLKELGIKVVNHIPHRQNDGYGLNLAIADFAKEQNVKLLITVDCGTTSFAEVEKLNSYGIDVIIIDHHECGDEELPRALALINPKQKGCEYPYKSLASVGLVFKLVQAMKGKADEEDLSLVALGTIADVAPLRGENRILAKLGLLQIKKTKNKGLLALLDVAKIKDKDLTPYHIGFILGPRINATGRMDSAHRALDLFLSEDMTEAYELAQVLEKFNGARQKMQRDVVDEALEIAEQEMNFKDQKVIVLSKEGWHKGVLGIVASKLTDKYYRPSIVISLKDGVGTASARSIEGFHLHEMLQSCSNCLENFGGHEGAAGLTIKAENIDPFRLLINDFADKILNPQKLIPVVLIEGEVSLSSISLELCQDIENLQPFGEGNPEPVFCSKRVIVKSQPMILGKETLKFWVTDGKTSISAVGFGMARFKPLIVPGTAIDVAYHLSIDEWNKSPTPQLKIKDIKVSE